MYTAAEDLNTWGPFVRIDGFAVYVGVVCIVLWGFLPLRHSSPPLSASPLPIKNPPNESNHGPPIHGPPIRPGLAIYPRAYRLALDLLALAISCQPTATD